MGSRNYAQVAPTPETIALNAYIFMYGGHSLVTPHTALKQLWWTDERIEAKITRPFILSKLRGQERDFLDRPLAFGEGLTDDTYMDWILERAKRMFMILTEIGVPDQIFGCIDDSWTDDDLPLALQDISNLELAYENDDALNKKFYNTQFIYLLRQLKPQLHVDYGPKERIPMEHVNTWPHAVALQVYDRVHLPQRPDDVFMRRKFPLIDKDTGQSQHDQFMRDMHRAKAMNHEHIAPLWASYTSDNAGYALSSFVPEHTLATFMEHRTPSQYMRLSAVERKVLLCEWMHCLADGLAFIHDSGMSHASVRPTNVWIDHSNRIAFADLGCISTLQRGKKSPKTEAHDYAAPETQHSKNHFPSLRSSSPAISSIVPFPRRRRRESNASTTSATAPPLSDEPTNSRRNSLCTISRTDSSPITPSSSDLFHFPSLTTTVSQKFKNFSRVKPSSSSSFPHLSPAPTSAPRPSIPLPPPSLPSADIFSLGCIYLDILTFLLKGKLTNFIKFRSTPFPLPKALKRTTTTSSFSSSSAFSNSVIPVISDSKGDTSFHASLALNPLKLTSWLEILREEAVRQGGGGGQASSSHKHKFEMGDARTMSHIFGVAVPALLELVERMLDPIAELRPSALEIRDEVGGIFEGSKIGRDLCCEGREWDAAAAAAGWGEEEDGRGLAGFEFGVKKLVGMKIDDGDGAREEEGEGEGEVMGDGRRRGRREVRLEEDEEESEGVRSGGVGDVGVGMGERSIDGDVVGRSLKARSEISMVFLEEAQSIPKKKKTTGWRRALSRKR